MPDIIEVNDTDAVVRSKIIAILEFDGVSTDDISSWGIATNRLNLAANRLGLQTIENNMAGAEARARINALALSPAPVYPENTALPTVSGTPEYNQTLTATTGTWNGYPAVSYTYQWQADELPIPGATSSTYTITESDLGKQIRVGVTATNQSGPASVFSAPTATVISAPINSSLPTISGTAANGQTLTANNGSWIAFPTPTFTYQWKADGTNIAGATSQTLVLGNDQIGKEINVEVTATNSEGSVTESTAATARVTSAPINTVLPVFAAEAVEGKSISTTNGTWLGYPAPTYTYQWKRNGANISGATNQSYTVVAADVGQNITVTVTATNSINSVSATSVAKMAKPDWAETFDVWRNFATDVGDLPNPGDIHPSIIQAPNAAGTYSAFAANELVRNDLGLQTVPTRVNGVPNSAYVGASAPNTTPTGWQNWGVAGLTQQSINPVVDRGIPCVETTVGGTATSNGGQELRPTTTNNYFSVSPGEVVSFSVFLALLSGEPGDNPNSQIQIRITFRDASNSQVAIVDKTVTLTGSLERYLHENVTAPANTAFASCALRVPLTNGNSYQFTIRHGAFQLEKGPYSTPPILTTGSALTVAGNRQLLTGLATQLENGISGFFEYDALSPEMAAGRAVLYFSDGSTGNRFDIQYASSGQLRISAQSGGTGSTVSSTLGVSPVGRQRVAFVCSSTLIAARAVGGSDQRTVSVALPIGMNQLAFGGQGFNIGSNSYQISRKIALDFLSANEDPQVAINNAFEKAQLAAASA